MRHVFTSCAVLIVMAFHSYARAEIRSRNEFGLGVTSNANFDKENSKSDLFFKASSSNRWARGEHDLGFRLGYIGYSHEALNNVLSWRFSDEFSPRSLPWKFYGSLGGQSYPKGEPATTDVAFDNVNIQLSAERAWNLNATTGVVFGPGYELTYFTAFNHRVDHTIYIATAIDHEVDPNLNIAGRFDFGLVSSSQSDYGKAYFELGASMDYLVAKDWTLSGEFAARQSYFLKRAVSETTVVNQRRGLRSTTTSQEKEAYSHLYLTGEAMHSLNKNLRMGGVLSLLSQSSKSGLQDYSAMEILARMLLIF